MLGAVIGDIVGSRFEFNNTHCFDFELFTPACNFTDDTICTIAMADAAENGAYPPSPNGKIHPKICRKGVKTA